MSRAKTVNVDDVIKDARANRTKSPHAAAGKTVNAAMILKPKRGKGRPEKYTEKIGSELCKRVSQGETITAFCKSVGISLESVYRWADKYPDFRDKYNRARKDQATSLISSLVDEFQADLTNANALAARTKADLYKWIAARQAPTEYGDVKRVELSGEIQHTHIHDLAVEQKRRIAESWLMSQTEDMPGITAETSGPALPAMATLEQAAVGSADTEEGRVLPTRRSWPQDWTRA